jgi:indolepyruvate ferredoxin oxidoreductase, alpha subunit
MSDGEVLMGNGAIARGLVEAGCQGVFGYPGTPSSEIIPEVVRFKKKEGLSTYTEWSVNEKVALEAALAFAWTGKRAAVIMKQVGLNVASDPMMSAAYTGTTGGFLIVSCDDPGPHSSQTEQDSRVHAMFAKLPVFDPASPEEALRMAAYALDLSERYRTPVILRASIRICHARQWIPFAEPGGPAKAAAFEREPERWAATPKFRLKLHHELNDKLRAIAVEEKTRKEWNRVEGPDAGPLGIVAGGPSLAHLRDLLKEEGLDLPLFSVGMSYPLDHGLLDSFVASHKRALVLEEPEDAVESQFTDRTRVMGRRSGHVPSAGELTPEVIASILARAMAEATGEPSPAERQPDRLDEAVAKLAVTGRRPTLCAGCPHRASFYAIRKALPRAIYTSDIGCYTLGINLKAVDTFLDMGAAVSMAAGFHQAYNQDGEKKTVVGTIGDSTFFHSGLSGLLSSVYTNARFILVILDNAVTAMTGMQPTPGTGVLADGSQGNAVPLEEAVRGAGVEFLEVLDPYDFSGMKETLLRAERYIHSPEGGVAVIIARSPCLIHEKAARRQWEGNSVAVDPDKCIGCGMCVKTFECPALIQEEPKGKVQVDRTLCVDCASCVVACKQEALVVDQR